MAPSRKPQVSQTRSEVDEYYRLALGSEPLQSFRDLDDATYLHDILYRIQRHDASNFVLDFSDVAAFNSSDLSTTAIDALLDAERPDSLSTRWINVWYPQRQAPLIELLAKKYDFSPRLLALMISDPKRRNLTMETKPASPTKTRQKLVRHFTPPRTVDDEIEKGYEEFSELSTLSSLESVSKGNLYRIIDDLWHYSSIDFGRSYVCMGYNSLYGIDDDGEDYNGGRLPRCIRLWTWLVLCDDHTVISINEDPFPFSELRLDQAQQRTLTETRRNLVNVFRSLSKAEEESMMLQKPLAMFPIRARLGETPEESAHRLSDMPGLLFYYLFENWHNSYSLITRRESRYGVELKSLRSEMFDKPELRHIDRLDTIGTELGVLKHHFESYNRLIDRLLEPRTITDASIKNFRVATQSSQASLDTVRQQALNEQETTLGVSLSSPVRVRFERLKDMIAMHALTEVEEFIKQKESLVNMVSPLHRPRYQLHLLTTSREELPAHHDQRVTRRGTLDPHHAPPDEAHLCLPSRQLNDGLFFRSNK